MNGVPMNGVPMNRMRQRGFSLVEVLVALVIIGVGMLGIAKIQALAYASTGTAALRSLAAIEASSLASAMRANRDYWTVTAATATQTIAGAGQTLTSSTDGALLATTNCVAVTCATAAAVAAYDVQSWMKSLNSVLPGDTATVICSPPTATGSPAGYPVGCNITISWYERNAAINAQSQGQTMALPTYTLYVEP
jgi:type IV pilus assembly protein PilV